MPFGNEGTQPGVGLALSGGGFRATLFHVGSLWRLNELGFLQKLNRISSVSGGSITAGLLGVRWNSLNFQSEVAMNFDSEIVRPLRAFCRLDIDVPAIAEGAFLPWKKICDVVREAYEDHLLGRAGLQDLPDNPRFVFNTTNLQTGIDFRFSKPYAGEYRLGLIRKPRFTVAQAVTASSAFPPFLSPVLIETDPVQFEPVTGADLCAHEDYCRKLYLSDGGVYDNLALETVWNRYDTVLASDAGAALKIGEEVETAWVKQVLRALDIATNQSRGLRKRALIDDFQNGRRKGAYWGIKTDIADYHVPDSLPCGPSKIEELAGIRTRLNCFSDREQCELINWGYAVCDAAMRKYVLQGVVAPAPVWPYSDYALG